MSPEDRELLNRVAEISQENNKMLKAISRSMRTARIMSYIYWIFIIGSAVGAYYLIQPYVESLTEAYGGIKSGFESSTLSDYLNLLNE